MERLNAMQFGVTELQSMPTRLASGRMELLEPDGRDAPGLL